MPTAEGSEESRFQFLFALFDFSRGLGGRLLGVDGPGISRSHERASEQW